MRSSAAPVDAGHSPAAVEVTLEDVARSAGVSQSTASRVLNGSARRVRPENERLVRAAAARLGYVVDLRAQATAGRPSNTVLVVVGSLRDTTAMQIAAGIHAWADPEGYAVSVSASCFTTESAAEAVRMLRGQRPRAIFVVAADETVISRGVQRELALYEAHGGLSVAIALDAVTPTFDGTDDAFVRGQQLAQQALSAPV